MSACHLCSEPVVWHPGNGGQWLGATPPRDWMTCYGSAYGPRHEVAATNAETLATAGHVAKLEATLRMTVALGYRWVGFDDSHDYGDALLRTLGPDACATQPGPSS